jgi:hypothetical protein
MKLGTRVFDYRGNIGTIIGFREHPFMKDVQQAEIKFDDPKAVYGRSYITVSQLTELKAPEKLEDVLKELYQKAFQNYENEGYSGNERGQAVYGIQCDTLKLLATRVLNIDLGVK